MRTEWRRWTAALCLILGHTAIARAAPLSVSYSFTLVAESSGPFTSVGRGSINDEGTVAFLASLRDGGQAIVIGNGGATTMLYATGDSFAAFPLTAPGINDAGTVAFVAELVSAASSIFTGNGGPTTTIADTSGRFRSFISQRSPISEAGAVAFSANLTAGGSGVFSGSGDPVTTIADSTGPFTLFSFQSINRAGTVAFAAGTSGLDAIVAGDGGPLSVLYDTSGRFSSFRPPDINDAGTVAFFAQLDDSSTGIFSGNGGPVTTIAGSSSSFMPFNDPGVNNQGMVAFTAFLGLDNIGIFTGPDAIGDRVVASGDPLFGSTVVGIEFDPNGLNDAGQIAFSASLADGRQVVARADAVVPEAPTFVLLGLGVFFSVCFFRRGLVAVTFPRPAC